MSFSKAQFQKVRDWMYRQARPLDLARWQYHFEDGTREPVLKALAAYQNADGGFGHALEADCWNPASVPLVSWVATEILFELDLFEYDRPLVRNLLCYLENTLDYRAGYWYAMVPGNNHHPHAPWWRFQDQATVKTTWGYNPTIALAGFVLCAAPKQSCLFKAASDVAQRAIQSYLQGPLLAEMHEAACFVRFFEYCQKAGLNDIVDLSALQTKLNAQVVTSVTTDITRWRTEYSCRPSVFILSPKSVFYPVIQAQADYEADFIAKTVNVDGVWKIPWNWDAFSEVWPVAKTWWQGHVALQNMRYLKNFHCLEQ